MVKRLKKVLNLAKNVLNFTYAVFEFIITIIGFWILFTALPFTAYMIIRYAPPLLGNRVYNLVLAFAIDVVYLFVLGYIILPLYERKRIKDFEEMAGAIVAYKARKWKAKLGKVDEVEDE